MRSFNKIRNWAARGDRWWIRAGATAAAVSFVVQAPARMPYRSLTWQAVMRQRYDLFAPLGAPGTHEAKLTFRVVPPLFLRVVSLSPWGYFVLQVALGVVTLGLIARLLSEYGFSRNEALAVVIAFGATAIGASWFADTRPLFDALALSGLIVALSTRNGAVVLVALTVAMWTDERAIIAALPVVVFHHAHERRRAATSALAGLILYGVARYWLTTRYAVSVDRQWVGLDILIDNIRYAPLALALSLEAIWAILGIALVGLLRARKWVAAPLVISGITSGFVAVVVYDVSRSAAYLLPVVLVSLIEGAQFIDYRRELLAGAAALCVLFPTAIVTGYPAMPTLLPLPLQLIVWLTHHS